MNTKTKVILRINTLMKDDNCTGNADENDVSTTECISTRQVFSSNQTAKSNTIGGEMQKNMLSICLQTTTSRNETELDSYYN